MKQIHGAQVKDLVTKFFYRENHLCYQIILVVEGGERIPYKEFSDYSEYKKAFAELLQKKGQSSIIKLPEPSASSNGVESNVA
ncbi:MAG: hypothetical protein KatS3mg030_723 [Saprospiraceae bacterium]|nr:MAG: hypothetical protein KatS3mg030_723 [Saprospiraceae bacterium]